MTYYELVYNLISDYIAHNNITKFDTKPYYQAFNNLKKQYGDREYYANVFSYIVRFMERHYNSFYVKKNPNELINPNDKMNLPILLYKNVVYLYDRYRVKDYVEVCNFNNRFEVARFRKKYQINFNKPFVDVRQENLIYTYMFDYQLCEIKNLNLLVFGTMPDDEHPDFATFANQSNTTDDFYFIGYDFKNEKILEKLPVGIDVLKLLIHCRKDC